MVTVKEQTLKDCIARPMARTVPPACQNPIEYVHGWQRLNQV